MNGTHQPAPPSPSSTELAALLKDLNLDKETRELVERLLEATITMEREQNRKERK